MTNIDVYREVTRYTPYVMLLFGIAAVLGIAVQWFMGTLPADPILWRISGGTSHHAIVMVGISLGYFGLVKIAKLKPVTAVIALVIGVSIHEVMWWTVDYVLYGWFSIGPIQMMAYVIILSFVYWRIRPPIVYIELMTMVYLVWIIVGFPVTVNFAYPGTTSLYWDLNTNMIEDGSWLIALLALPLVFTASKRLDEAVRYILQRFMTVQNQLTKGVNS